MSEPKTNIPKFVSFRSKPAPPGSPKPNKDEEKRHASEQKDGSSIQEDRMRHHRHRRSKSRQRDHKHKSAFQNVAKPTTSKDEALEFFLVDRKGDVNNLVYGSIHRYNVPSFHRSGAGGVLGAPSNLKIDRNYDDEMGIVLSNRTHLGSNFREKYVFSNIDRDKPRLLKIRHKLEAEPSVNIESDYISLQGTKERKRHRGDLRDFSGSEQDEVDYRSIHGKVKAHDQLMEDDLQYATESETSGSETGRAIKVDQLSRQKTADLSRKVEQYPHDIDAWIALIEHQDTLIGAGDGHRRATNAEIRSTADIKIHMYEKALEKARSLPDRERLLLGLMSEGSKVWEIKAQSEKWEQISKDNIESLVLWKSYVAFKQTTFSTFRYEEVKEVFVKRIKLLTAAISSAGPEKDESLYQQLFYVFLRLTLYVRESGYSELAVGIWQGLLEFNFFAPNPTESPFRRLAQFREFWESEVPRIGEPNALGWSHFMENKISSEPPEPVADNAVQPLDNRTIFESWATSEQLQGRASRVPARTMDEVMEDDPFRVILASDLEDYLVPLPPDSETLRRSLLNAFLLFCHLPPVENLTDGTKGIPSYDKFIKGDLLECLSANTWQDSKTRDHNLLENTKSDIKSIFKTPVSRFASSSESMFARYWFNKLYSWTVYYSGDNGPVSYKWLRTALQQLTRVCSSDDIGEYYLSFEWRNEPDTIKKVSKALLRQYPSSLRLYNAYGMIEYSRGNRQVANGVFTAALDMSKSMPEGDRKYTIILWNSWIWASLEDIENDTALRRLLAIANTSPDVSVAATGLLKAKQHLSSNRDCFLMLGDARIAIVYAECIALLDYLSSRSDLETQSNDQGDINAALSAYSSFSQTLINRGLASSTPHELLLQSTARLLYHHARIGPFRPALLREHLTSFLTLFPQNTIFLSLYAFNESRLRIDNRVRSILLSTILTPQNDTITSRVFAIHFEIVHGTIHSVRATFENALSSPVATSCAGLWRCYLMYCLGTPQFHSQVKDVWYRALRACPWAKELYVLGFERLEGLVEFEELKGTWRVMGEKELRVHIDLEDKFEEISELDNKSSVQGQIKGIGADVVGKP